jgi:aryl-alcohol dehydrogenase-like predicted oxidoreductase
MQYNILGNTGLVVSRLAFGAMTFTTGEKATPGIAKVGKALADEMVGRCLDAGINFFDTADRYSEGESEILLGGAIKHRRYDVILSTKCGGRAGPSVHQAGNSRRHIMWSIDQSLKRLGTDWVDIYMLHRDDPYTPLEVTLAAMDDVVRSGKARYIGFSNWPAWRVAAALEIQKANNFALFTHGQLFYSLLGRDIERDLIPALQQYGLGLTTWSPLASGFLSGKYVRGEQKGADTRLAGGVGLPMDQERAFDLLDKMRPIAAARNASLAQIAIAWLLAQKAVSSVLLGAAKLSQLDDNIGAAGIKLSSEEIKLLSDMTSPPQRYPNWFIEAGVDRVVAELLAR